MQSLAIRFDACRDGVFNDVCEWIKDKSKRCYMYEEEGDMTGKVHYQGVIDLVVDDDNTIAKWGKRFKSVVKPPGKNQYSLTAIRTDNYKVYVTKDKKRVIQIGYSDEELEELEAKSYPKGTAKQAKGKTFAQALFDECVEKFVRYETELVYPDLANSSRRTLRLIDEREVAIHVTKYFCKYTKVFDKFIIRKFVRMIIEKIHIEYGSGEPTMSFIDSVLE